MSRMPQVRTIRLSVPVRLALPPVLLSSIPKKVLGLSFETGMAGVTLGLALLGASLSLGYVLLHIAGPWSFVLSFWLMGGTGAVMILNCATPVAFVKQLCSNCRLLPVIVEHESLHLSGIESDESVWDEMRKRYSCASLGLEGDTSICSFCPIPKRLRGQ